MDETVAGAVGLLIDISKRHDDMKAALIPVVSFIIASPPISPCDNVCSDSIVGHSEKLRSTNLRLLRRLDIPQS